MVLTYRDHQNILISLLIISDLRTKLNDSLNRLVPCFFRLLTSRPLLNLLGRDLLDLYPFSLLGELVKDGMNGDLFENSSQLSSILVDWFKGFPEKPSSKHHLYRWPLPHSKFHISNKYEYPHPPIRFCCIKGYPLRMRLQR